MKTEMDLSFEIILAKPRASISAGGTTCAPPSLPPKTRPDLGGGWLIERKLPARTVVSPSFTALAVPAVVVGTVCRFPPASLNPSPSSFKTICPFDALPDEARKKRLGSRARPNPNGTGWPARSSSLPATKPCRALLFLDYPF